MAQDIIVGIVVTVVGGVILQILLSKLRFSIDVPRLNMSRSCLFKLLLFGMAVVVAAFTAPSDMFSPAGLVAVIFVGGALLLTEL